MLEKIHFHSRTTEVGACIARVVNAYQNTSLSSDANLVSFVDQLKLKNDELILAINRSKADSVLYEMDELRDSKLRALNYFVQGAVYNPDDSIQSAAKVLNAIINKYGLSVIGESYATESTLLKSLLADFENTEIENAISTLVGSAQLIQELKAAQENFENTRLHYEEDKAVEASYSNASELRSEIIKLFNHKIVIYLRAMEIVNAENYGSFIATLNEIITANNTVVEKRQNKTVEMA